MLSWLEKVDREKAKLAARAADPLLEAVKSAVKGREAIATASLLDLLDLPKTTGSARRIGAIMKSMGYVPLKSRLFAGAGWRSTIGRGWAKPTFKQGDKVGSLHPKSDDRKEPCHVQS